MDEIGELPLGVQILLLRVLQTKEFERVGGSKRIKSDFRLIAATNCDLNMKVEDKSFRSDLYYRINVFPIHIPPLRHRKEDIPLLASYFLKIHARKKGKKSERIPPEEMEKLLQYDFPGNIRELENLIERGVILSLGGDFRVPELVSNPFDFAYPKNRPMSLKENERRHILWALQKTKWKIRGAGGAAELLDIHPSTLAFRMKKLGILRPKKNGARVH